jgi:HSP20 family protein
MRRAMDRLIENSFGDELGEETTWGLPLDVVEEEDFYLVRASVPGIKPDELEITYDKGSLTINGEIKDDSEPDKGKYHLRERRWGLFSRTISLPSSVKPDDIRASYNEGVLTLRLPKTEDVKPRRIPIHASQKAIDGKSSRN